MRNSRAIMIPAVSISCLFVSARATQGQCTYDWRPGEMVPGVSSTVLATTTWDADGPGGQPELLIVAGEFYTAGGLITNGIAAWNGNAWLPFGSGMNSTVYALTVFNGELIAGGGFTSADGSTANNIARWTGTSWQPLGLGMNSAVFKLTNYNGELIAGGFFTLAGGAPANRIARWDGSSWLPLGSGLTGGASIQVADMTVFGNELIVCGFFTNAGGIPAFNIARWNGSMWQSFGTNTYVNAVTVFNGELIASRILSSGIAAWNGTSWRPLGTGINGFVSEFAIHHGSLFATGNFTIAGGVAADYIARWDGAAWHSLSSGWYQAVAAMTSYNGELIVGGYFSTAGGVRCNNLARWNDGIWKSFGNGFLGICRSIIQHNNSLIIATGIWNDNAFRGPARWDGESWSIVGTGLVGGVLCLLDYNKEVIAGGEIVSTPEGTPLNHIARWDGSAWLPLGEGINYRVLALSEYQGELVAAGYSLGVGGGSESRISRWNGTQWLSLGSGLGGGYNDGVSALANFEGKLIAAGGFSMAGGVPVANIAIWDGKEWSPFGSGIELFYSVLGVHEGDLFAGANQRVLRWMGSDWEQLGGGLGGGTYGPVVLSMTHFNGELIVGGEFSTIGNVPAYCIARWNGTQWLPLGTGLNGSALALATYHGDLIAGGYFSFAGSRPSASFARYGPTDPLPTISQHPASPAVCQGSAISLRSTATGDGTLSFQWRKGGIDLTDDDDTFGTQSNTLVFAHAAASDAGPYDCLVKLNDCTEATSNTATLAVFPTNTADGNNDGLTDARDIAVFVDSLTNFAPVSAPLCANDLTGEGIVNSDDIPPFVARLLAE